MADLPSIGRNGLVNSIRRLSGFTNPGYRKVNADAVFVAGMVASLEADANGNPELQTANATDKTIIGVFFCHKTSYFYRPIVNEAQTYTTDAVHTSNTATVAYLEHANLRSGSVVVRSTTSTGVTFTEDTDYTVSYTNGTITRIAGKGIGATDTVYVTYSYKDPDLTGIDETMGSNCAATLEDQGEAATLVYDTSVAYTLMGNLFSNSAGYLTSTDGTGGIVGFVTKVPTADDPELHFKLAINNA